MVRAGGNCDITQPRVRRLPALFVVSIAVLTLPFNVRAATHGSVAIVTTGHPRYRGTVVDLERALAAAGIPSEVIKVPAASIRQGQEEEDGEDSSPQEGAVTPEAAREAARQKLVEGKPALVVTLGVNPTRWVVDQVPDVPIVFCMVPNGLDLLDELRQAGHKQRVAGVTTDVAPAAQVEYIVRFYAPNTNIGLLHSDHTVQTARALQAAGRNYDVTITLIETQRDQFPQAIDALNAKHCDGVLMIADAGVYNAANVQRLLLWGLRMKRPVFAFSANVVKAGAFSGQYCQINSIDDETARVVQEALKGKPLEKIGLRYPSDVATALNERTAEMIEATIDPNVQKSVNVRFGKE